jgi:hypothetical protein
MSDGTVIVGTVVGVTVGIVASHIGNQFYKQLNDRIHKEEIEEAKASSFQEGWRAASNSTENIRKRFTEMFGKPDEGKGTTTKAPKAA